MDASSPSILVDDADRWRPFAARRTERLAAAEAPDGTSSNRQGLFGGDGPSFGDLIDTLNPLHHVPIVGTAYRALTGDELSHGPRIIGGAAFAGPIGLLSAGVNIALVEETGRDAGQTVLSWMGRQSAETVLAQAGAGKDGEAKRDAGNGIEPKPEAITLAAPSMPPRTGAAQSIESPQIDAEPPGQDNSPADPASAIPPDLAGRMMSSLDAYARMMELRHAAFTANGADTAHPNELFDGSDRQP
ncbi:MAG: hypothetical protein AAGF19_08190 [Pseudomonadota bacterium]